MPTSSARNERRKVNEVAPAVASAVQLIIKNLPLILKALKPFIDALKSDQINDNSELIDLLTKFGQSVCSLV